ncbi:neutral cholesterol ester hydrolase 1 isoform X1 [Eublepharis macularius]|uniref:Neutral cholesterol ester hydrolase 1 n=2 Tax=Eublepharis macularius TaxID=481883 RepID=A0AA97JH50_EUBMA|nr:neutral cholesterol ester hydrolase 1 isoform X1 [Eublepharis macularius]
MKSAVVLLAGLCAFTAYYVYLPLPSTVSEPWRLMLLDASFRIAQQTCNLGHYLGLGHHLRLLNFIIGTFDKLNPQQAERVKITDTQFDGVEVRLYRPHAKEEKTLWRSVVYIHGGGWALSSTRGSFYNNLCSIMAESLDAVVISIEYRLVPDFHFPVQFNDVLRATRYFMRPEVLAQYSVDPSRIAISGDSAGGNLAAAVCQEMSQDQNETNRFKLQALVYPVLQAFDFNTPSYQQNEVTPVLPRFVMVKFWIDYFNGNYEFAPSMVVNNHTSLDVSQTNSFRDHVDWTSLVSARFRKNYKPVMPSTGKVEILQDIPSLLDVHAAPLLAKKEVLRFQPKTYILTCEIDVLRDDGIMYAKRLEEAGVEVTVDHFEDCFHGCMIFTIWPTNFSAGIRTRDSYIKWLSENL